MTSNSNRRRALVVAAATTIPSLVAPPACAGQRPLSDFLDAQGVGVNSWPPVPDSIGWGNNLPENQGIWRFALVDDPGMAAEPLETSGGAFLGTAVRSTHLACRKAESEKTC